MEKTTAINSPRTGDQGRSVLGIDIGGTGIKGAVVDPETGTLLTDRYPVPTPHPAVPEKVSDVVAELV